MKFQYDARREKCPLPLVKLRLLLKKMQDDDVCVIQLSDSGSIEDIPKLLVKLGYYYSATVIAQNVVEMSITKTKN